MKKNSLQSAVVGISALLISMIVSPRGSAQGFTIITPAESAAATGMTYGEWSAVWFQYTLSKNSNDPNNPLLDPTGKGCAVDQPRSSPVFFLSGGFGSATFVRNECVVPAGKVLFFPLIDAIDVHVPGDGLDTPELVRNDLLYNLLFTASTLFASIDGVAINNLDPQTTPYRACAGGAAECTAAFSVTLPGNNLFVGSPAGMGRHGKPAIRGGVYSPAVADGYYLMISPLTPGPHTITFGGTGFLGSMFSQDITYHLVVK